MSLQVSSNEMCASISSYNKLQKVKKVAYSLYHGFPTSQPVVRVPLVVREGLPGGARVTTIFTKTRFLVFVFCVSGFVFK